MVAGRLSGETKLRLDLYLYNKCHFFESRFLEITLYNAHLDAEMVY